MFEELSAAVDGLVIPPAGDALVEGFGVFDRLECRLIEAVWAFDETCEWSEQEGAASVAAWLRIRCGLTNGDAHRIARTARRLRRLPATFAAWRDGTIAGGQVRVICANLTDRTAPLFGEWEDHVLGHLAGRDVHETTVLMKHWAARAKELLDDGRDRGEPDPDRSAHLSPTLDGTGRLDANLDAEGHQAVQAALRLAMGGPPAADDERTAAQRRYDALVAVFVHFLDHQREKVGGRHRPHLNVTIELMALLARAGQGQHLDGTAVAAEDARRLACDANVHRVITDPDGTVLDYGRATRTVSAALFLVLCLRDQRCRFPGCDRPCHLTDAHHVRHWLDGGPTRQENLVLLCRWHHQVVHRPGWSLQLLPDATVVVTGPDGRRRTSHPPGWIRRALDLPDVA